MKRFSKKSSTLSLNSNLSIISIPKPYNALEHFEICINITKNCNLSIPESHKTFYESYKKYTTFKKYPYVDVRFELDSIKKPLLVSCCDTTKYMIELALPEKINKLKFNYNWSMERWKIMYKKRIAIDRFKNFVEKVIENCKKNMELNNNVISIKCDPWVHYMPDPYQDSTVHTTKYCLKKIKEKNYSYYVCENEFFSEVKYHSHYLNSFKETIDDSDENDIQLPSSFNNNYNYKESLKEKKNRKKISIRDKPYTNYSISNHNKHNIEFIYFVRKIIMERKKTNPSGDPWDAFFYIHMEPNKKNLTFKMNKNEMAIIKNDSVPGVKCLDEDIIKENNNIISLSSSTSLTSQPSDYDNNDNNILNDDIEMEKDNVIEIIEKNKEDFEKFNLYDDKNIKIDKNNDHNVMNNIVFSPKYLNDNTDLSRNIISFNKSSLQLLKNNNDIIFKDENISKKEEIIVKPISKDISIDVCDRETNTLPLLNKNSKVKYPYNGIKRKFPTNSKKQKQGSINWKVTTIVRYSPDGRTTSNRSFYLPRIVHSNLKPLPKTSINIPFSNNSITLPSIPKTSSRPSSSLNKTITSTSHQNLFPKLL